MNDGHVELKGLLDSAADHDASAGDGVYLPDDVEREHASEFRTVVVLALRNLAFRVASLEVSLGVAEEKIRRLEGR